MLDKNTHEIFHQLNNQFTTNLDALNEIKDPLGLSNTLQTTRCYHTNCIFTKATLPEEDQTALLVYLEWLFNKLICVSLYTNDVNLEQSNTDLQQVIALKSYRLLRRWFHRLISLYTSLLSQSLVWEDKKSIEIDLPKPSEEELKKVPIKLTFSTISINSKQQFDNIVKTTLTVLNFSILHYCNAKPELAIKTCEVALDVCCQKTLIHKTKSLEFFETYFNHLVTFTDADINFFLSILETLAYIFKNISKMISATKEEIDEFILQIESFLKNAPVTMMEFGNQQNQQRLVIAASEILYCQLKNGKQTWFDPYLPDILTNLLMTVLDNNEFKLETIEPFRALLEIDDQSVALMKYLVMAELEESVDLQCQQINVSSVSKCWKAMHERLVSHLNKLPATEFFSYHWNCVSDYLILAVQIEFRVSQRFQYLRGMRVNVGDPTNSTWNLQPVQLLLFDDIEKHAQKMLCALERCTMDSVIVRCSMDIFTCVLKLSNDSKLVVTVKQILVAIVASPFYSSLNNNQQYRKLGGFQKIMTLLPNAFKKFISETVESKHLQKMKCDSIALLSQLEISKIHNACWWLVENIITYIVSEGDDELKMSFYNSFVSFSLNNKIQFCFEKYEKLLKEFRDPSLVISTLRDVLCLAANDAVILKLPSIEHDFKYSIVCNKCIHVATIYPKSPDLNENKRLLALMKDTKGLIVTLASNQPRNLVINVPNFFGESNEFIIELIPKLSAMLNHSEEFQASVISDRGKALFQMMFAIDEAVLEVLEWNFNDFIQNIQQLPCEDKQKAEILKNCFLQICEVVKVTAYGTDLKLQLLTINLNFKFSTFVVEENGLVNCFKIFLLFIVQSNSQVVGEASDLALNMAHRHGISLLKLFNWHKTYIMQHLTRLLVTNLLQHKTGFSSSMLNLIRRLNLGRLRDFLPIVLDMIISITIPMGLQSPKLMKELESLCSLIGTSLAQAIISNILAIYLDLYTSQDRLVLHKCVQFIEKETDMSIKEMITENRETIAYNVLIYYNKSPTFVMEVLLILLKRYKPGATMDDIADELTTRFLGVLFFFEPLITSIDCERATKKKILLSLGDIIRMLGTKRISGYCFKIINVLKAAFEQTSVDLSESCIRVWDILIRTCNVANLGPILGTIFVSLEALIEKYPDEVERIYSYLVVENSNSLSRYIKDLFFIEKMSVSKSIKDTVLHLMHSQILRDEENFDANLQSLMRYMNSDNSDLKIRVYCLQHLKELFRKHRGEVNNLICGQMTMDSSLEELLFILINNCKSTSKMLQLATAECLGELGAVETSRLQPNYASQQEYPKTIHSNEFAKMALDQLCRSYQHKSDTKYIDALSLAIQQILKSRGVTEATHKEHEVWLSIPEKMRPLMEPLLRSTYSPRQQQISDETPIFWNQTQTAADWAITFAGVLINRINKEDTKCLLECVKPSMKQNHQAISMFLPYILLHNLEMGELRDVNAIKDEIQHVFDIIMDNKCTEHNKEQNQRRPLYVKSFDFCTVDSVKKPSPEKSIKQEAIKVAKMIFEAFDFLENYRRSNNGLLTKIISDLLDKFDTEEMAVVNYKCGEFARAMIYFESRIKTIRAADGDIQSKLNFFMNIHAKLRNPDSVVGIQALKTTEWSLEEKLLINHVTGNYKDSASACEKMMQIGKPKVEHIEHMLNTFIALDQPETALLVYEKMIRVVSESQRKDLSELKAEPLWRLSRYDELDSLLKTESVQQSTSWGVRCGQLLLKFRSENRENFLDELCNTRHAVMKSLKISGNEQTAYGKNYREIINLHLITEFEKAGEAFERMNSATNDARIKIVQNLIDEFNQRMDFVQKRATIEEPIFCFHRILLGETKQMLQKKFGNEVKPVTDLINTEIGRLWIKSTKLACKNKMYQQAQIYILNAEAYEPKDLFLEKAKLDWIKGDQKNAFDTLELGCKKLLGLKTVEALSKDDKVIYSKGKLMIARYNADAIHLEFDVNKALFKEARVKGAENEKVYLLMAEYIDRHYCIEGDNQMSPIGRPTYMVEVMEAYGRSMLYGNEYVFQSMPRFLSIWFDSADKHSSNVNNKADILRMNVIVKTMTEKLNEYYFYTAFSQLMSRLCHTSTDVFDVLKTILIKVILAYTQQSLWLLIPMFRSSHTQRVKRCKELFSDPRLKKMSGLVNEFNKMHINWIKLAQTDLPKDAKQFSLKAIGLESLTHHSKTSIIIPFLSSLQLTRIWKENTFKFATGMVHIHKMKETGLIMSSLVRPRKVTIVGDDGQQYHLLFKKDDLRIDRRFLEFTAILKEFLHKDPESRQRHLTTRSYAAIPLDETYGVIEWVPNLRTLKDIIASEYETKGHRPPKNHEISKLLSKMNTENKVREFRKLVGVFYPALGDYFRKQFSSPQNYYNARMSFIRTTAAMSIIGYIMGLGDRHCENILIDIRSGETFHVDFNCLFNKGENLAVPETVPFRLTHNMIDAMGVLGIEGPFRRSCEIFLRVMQKEKKTLMSYLRPLVYEVPSKVTANRNTEHIEQENVESIKNIEMRLKGICRKYKGSSGIPLSTEGQVNFIIDEATKEQNLAGMFFGWAPWI